ncbi:MAG TPA: hypothetical protein VN278_00870, partial [Methanosarcina sp.]|nr:hypothetical protein [Methanosarcina sp.]
DFEYEISPTSALNISMPENSVVDNPSDTLFGKEQKHRNFADLITEYLTLSLIVSNNGSSIHLNPLAAEYCFSACMEGMSKTPASEMSTSKKRASKTAE